MIRVLLIQFLAVSIVLSALVYAPAMLRRHRQGMQIAWIRHSILYLFLVYFLYLSIVTVLFGINFHPEQHSFNLRPFLLEGGLLPGNEGLLRDQFIVNTLMFFPMGFLSPIVMKQMRSFGSTFIFVLLAAATKEILQYFTGRSADVDDFIINLAGGCIGYAAFALFGRFCCGRRWWGRMMGDA